MSCFRPPRLPLDRVLDDRVLRVGELLVVVEEILAPQAGDALRVRGDAQPPQRDVDVVDAVVADVAAAEVIPPSPDARQQVGAVRYGRRRTKPEIEIQMLGWVGRFLLADRAAQLAVPGLGDEYLADLALADAYHGFLTEGSATALGPDLKTFARALHRVRHQPALADVMATRFLDVDVFARLQRQDRRRRVPVVRRSD
jgi:hypothetical protein